MSGGITNVIGLNSQYYIQHQKAGNSKMVCDSHLHSLTNTDVTQTPTSTCTIETSNSSTASSNSSTASSGVSSSILSPSKTISELQQQQQHQIVTINYDLLSTNVRTELDQLELELLEGDITQKGYEKKKAKLLAPFMISQQQMSSRKYLN